MILRTAAADDCDLIIIGSSAQTWRSRWLRNYTLKKVTACASQPLLVVTAPPAESYAGTTWSRLLVVHDGSRSAAASAHYALTLAQEAALDVCLLHVNAVRQHHDLGTLCRIAAEPDMASWAAAQAAITDVRHAAPSASGDLAIAIVETAAAQACGVIVLGVAQGNGWRRLAQRRMVRAVLANTTLPVLLVNRSAIYWD
jgi:nucleotide-binding universal stress UspA family protein